MNVDVRGYTGLGGGTPRLHQKYSGVDAPTFLCIGQGLGTGIQAEYF